MKKTIVKHLIYKNDTEEIIGSFEYDGRLTDDNILCAVHEVGHTTWIGQSLWKLRNGIPQYRISVETFYQYQKSWYNLLSDSIKRILRI